MPASQQCGARPDEPAAADLSPLAREIKKQQPFTSPTEEAYLNLLRTESQLAGQAERLFKSFGISGTKYNVLRILRILRGAAHTEPDLHPDECGSPGLPSLEIADRLITRVPDITRLVDGLLADGLVERTRCVKDRRVVYVSLTEAGLNRVNELDEPLATLQGEMFAGLTPGDLQDLNRLLVLARQPAPNAV